MTSLEKLSRDQFYMGIKCFRYLNYLDYVSERGKMFEFLMPAFSLGVREGEGWIGEKVLCDLPRHNAVTAKIILSIPLFLSTHLDGKLFSSANEWTQIQVGTNTPQRNWKSVCPTCYSLCEKLHMELTLGRLSLKGQITAVSLVWLPTWLAQKQSQGKGCYSP